jgi:photosystem II stability/assembly factor-like uncharacterized protein
MTARAHIALGLVACMGAAAAGCGDKANKAEAATKVVGEKGQDGTDAHRAMALASSGASAQAAQKFKDWTPVPAFLGAPVVGGEVVSAREAIVFTRDNHVGVTTDGGATWGFSRLTTGTVRAVSGAPGGPFVVVGAGGFVSLSGDGKSWSDLPRITNEDLVAVAVGEAGIAAAGKGGAFLRMDRTGQDAEVNPLPDRFRATGVAVEGPRWVAYAGKKGYDSTDGVTFTPTDRVPAAAGRESATSRGLCGLGRVGKKSGVVCKIDGVAYGVSDRDVVVVGRSHVAVTADGGSSWALAPLPLSSIKGVAGDGGALHVYDARGQVASTGDGGKTWTTTADPSVIDGAPAYPRPTPCEGRLPAPGEACKLARETTSPADLPDVRAFRFQGEVGLAMGDSGLVSMTADGGKTWTTTSGFALGALQGFDVRGDRVVAVGRAKTAVSTDGGKTFRLVDLPPKTPMLLGTHIAADGAVYLAGRSGTVLKAEGDLGAWVKLDTGEKNRADYVFLHEVGGALYAAGVRGELHRSADGGKTWVSVPTGVTDVVQKMAGEGEEVFAVTYVSRYGGNKLLRSTDGGQRFVVQRELSDQGLVGDFAWDSGALRYGNLVSRDAGATWSKYTDWYWPGSVDVADGSGVRITNVGSYYGKDRFYVIGPDKDDVTVVDSFYNKGATFRCDKGSGCWMLAGGQVYRPIL